MNLRLCNTEAKLVTYASKVTFKSSIIIDENLVMALLNRDIVHLNRPAYIGQSVLDISKVRMYELKYFQLDKYQGNIDIVAGDTDSFFLEVKGVHLDQLLLQMKEDGLLDTSNYNPTHPLYDAQSSKIGKVKDETGGKYYYKEWVFLRPKCYSLLTSENEEEMRAKGIMLRQTEIKHQSYLDVYSDNMKTLIVNQRRIASQSHQLVTIESSKVALKCFDDKRDWYRENASHAYGYIETMNN